MNKRKLNGAVSIEYVTLLVCLALASLVAFGVMGKSIGGIVNDTKDTLTEKVDNAADESLDEISAPESTDPSFEIVDGDGSDGKHYHNDELFTGTCNEKEYVDGVEQVILVAGLYDAEWNLLAELTKEEVETDYGDFAYPSKTNDNYKNAIHAVLPKSISKIGNNIFIFTNLTSVEIPDSVIQIGAGAFAVTNLESVIIPDSVTSIGVGAFSECYNLMSFNYNGTKAQWNSISKGNNWNYHLRYPLHCIDGDIGLYD